MSLSLAASIRARCRSRSAGRRVAVAGVAPVHAAAVAAHARDGADADGAADARAGAVAGGDGDATGGAGCTAVQMVPGGDARTGPGAALGVAG